MKKTQFRKLGFLSAIHSLICAIFVLCAYASQDLNIPLNIENTSGLGDRNQGPVTTGIPLPENANIHDSGVLSIRDAKSRIIPAQFSVLSRWGGLVSDATKPIKWVLMDFQADKLTETKAAFTLTALGRNIPPPYSVSVKENADGFEVNTGPASFLISKHHFNLFDEVRVGLAGGNLDKSVISQAGRGGIQLQDDKGKLFTSLLSAPEVVEIEESGPMRTVIRVRGILKSKDRSVFAPSVNNSPQFPRFNQPYPESFVYYNCRLHFYAGKSYVRIFLTLENNGANGRTNPEQTFAPIQTITFQSVDVVVCLDTTGETAITSHDGETQLTRGDTFSLYQDWAEKPNSQRRGTLEPVFEKGIYYRAKKNDETVSNGSISPGWIYSHTQDGLGIGLAIRHFWQNFPKKITMSPTELRIGLWPEEGYYPYCRRKDFPGDESALYCHQAGRDAGVYLFDAGRHKTHEFILNFSVDADADQTRSLAAILEHPLMALADPDWYARTKALGMIVPNGLSHSEPDLNEAMQRFEKHQLAMVDPEVSENKTTIQTLKIKNPPHWEFKRQHRFFGWMNFGDLFWSNQQPSSLHYDWPYSMLLHYLRTGERLFFDTGLEMTRHRYDIDQYHGERTDSKQRSHLWINHMAFYESDKHADPTISAWQPARVSMHSHTWNGGLVLYYLLTGDKKAWEAAMEVGQAAMNHYGPGGLRDAVHQTCAQSELRQETWPMLNLIHLYRAGGDPEVLRVAKNIAVNRILYREQKAGGHGIFGSGGCKDINAARQSNTMYSYALDPLIQIHYETQNKDLAALILRMADFMKDHYLFGGDFNKEGKYRPLQSLYAWRQEDPHGITSQKRGEPVKNTFNADLFAYAYLLSGKQIYLDLSRQSFRDAMFYYAAKGSSYLSPKYRSVLSFLDGMFSGSQTKVHGWLARTNQTYLFIEQNNAD